MIGYEKLALKGLPICNYDPSVITCDQAGKLSGEMFSGFTLALVEMAFYATVPIKWAS